MTSPEPAYTPPRTEVPVWVPFLALAAVLFIVSIFGLGVYAIVSITDPSLDGADELPGRRHAGADVHPGRRCSSSWPGSRSSSRSARRSRERFGLVRPQGVLNVLRWMAAAYAIFWVAAIVLSRDLRRARRADARHRPQERGRARRRGGLGRADLLPGADRRGVLLPRLHVHRARAPDGRRLGRDRRRHRVRDRARRGRRDHPAAGARGLRNGVVPPLLAHRVHHSVHGASCTQQFDHVRRDERPRARRSSRASWSSASAP